ncbi:MAG: hypothetical protein OXD36_03135 [Rhodobacter sp.]|nr:hypothetical protein [Rhodobacter sp.]
MKMEYENIKERKGAGTILRAGAALALVAALAACGGGSGTTTAGGGGSQCAAGETLVGGDCLTAAQVTANTAITDARNAATALFGNIADPSQGDIEGLETAIGTAETAIAGLPEDEREEADDLLDNARTVLASAKGVRAALDAPSPGTEQVADSGVAALAALRAYEAAKAAEKSAHDAIKILGTGGTSGHALGGTLNVKGDSAKAAEYAKKILDAVSELEKQETAVANEVEAIEEAITAFEALDSDEVDDYADRLESLRDDLRSAKRHQTQIAAIQLESEEYRVQSQSGRRKPSAFASYVAEKIGDAFDAEGARGADNSSPGWLRALPADGVIADSNPQNRIAHTDLLNADRREHIEDHGMIADTVPEGFKRLTLTSYGAVKGLIGVEDVPLSRFHDYGLAEGEDGVLTGTDLTAILATDADARVVGYKGLIATLWCGNQADCTQENRALKGPWYLRQSTAANDSTELEQGAADDLTPSDLTALYREIEGVYRAFEGGYVEYGYWLQGTDAEPQIVTFSDSTEAPSVEAAITNATTPAKATYKGDALGIAVVKTYDTNNNDAERAVTSRRSGHFTADVELNADFTGGDPNLEGTINNFQGGVADPTWNVVLQQTDITAASANVSNGVAVGRRGTVEATTGDGNTREGAWSATFTGGSATARPDAVYGGFGAYFPNGVATGGFQAER